MSCTTLANEVPKRFEPQQGPSITQQSALLAFQLPQQFTESRIDLADNLVWIIGDTHRLTVRRPPGGRKAKTMKEL
jgi:hypothetical protein